MSRWGSRTLSRAARTVLALVVVVAVALTVTVVVLTRGDDTSPDASTAASATDADADETPEVEGPLEAAAPPDLPSTCVEPGQLIPAVATRCDLLPYVAGNPTVVLWGDSHAWQLIPALRAAIGDREVNLVGFVFGSCPVMASNITTPRQRERSTECLQSNHLGEVFVRDAMATGQPVRVVTTEAWELYRDALAEPDLLGEDYETPRPDGIEKAATMGLGGTPRLFRFLARFQVPTDVVGPMPIVPTNAAPCAPTDAAVDAAEAPYACDVPREGALKDEAANLAQIATLMADLPAPARLIDPTPALCDETACRSVVDGMAVYFDEIHLGAEFAESLSTYFDDTVTALLSTPATPATPAPR